MNRSITHFIRHAHLFALLLVLGIAMASCTLSGINNDSGNAITEQDLQAAGQIIGESLSDNNSGVMTSLNDVFTSFSDDGFVLKSTAKGMGGSTSHGDMSGRGSETNFTHTYDPETGVHTLVFTRVVMDTDYAKSVTDTLKYIFTDAQGAFIEHPRAEKERIETIDFNGWREGSIESPRKNSFFTRRDTFLVDGVSAASELLSFDGKHVGEGNLEIETDTGNLLERSYEIRIDFLNIEINKSLVEANQSLEQGVTGTLSWEMVISKTNNGSTETKTIRGTVEFNGDGTALLRFRDFTKMFHINLDDGHVRDHDNEFEGHVQSVNLDRDQFVLKSGLIIQTGTDTEFDPSGDLFSLEEIASALENGLMVDSEGEGSRDGEIFDATSVRLETEERDHHRIEFEDATASVNLADSVVTLENGTTILVTSQTMIDDSGDFQSLEAVKEALNNGSLVISDGRGEKSDRSDIDVIAHRIRFDEEDHS